MLIMLIASNAILGYCRRKVLLAGLFRFFLIFPVLGKSEIDICSVGIFGFSRDSANKEESINSVGYGCTCLTMHKKFNVMV